LVSGFRANRQVLPVVLSGVVDVSDRSAVAYEAGPATEVSGLAALVRSAQAGNEAAFAELIDERRHRLYRTAWAILRSDADAFDAAQDVCVAAWRELPKLRDPGRFDAWLTRSLVNRCRTMLRSRRRISVHEVALDPDGDRGPSWDGGLGPGHADSDAIQRAYARLSADERTYLVLHYVEERPIAEIAQLVGAPSGTVKWRLSRARAALERQLARERR
jgi:RNA polymerase sigma-70 factor (ECF subfamily)